MLGEVIRDRPYEPRCLCDNLPKDAEGKVNDEMNNQTQQQRRMQHPNHEAVEMGEVIEVPVVSKEYPANDDGAEEVREEEEAVKVALDEPAVEDTCLREDLFVLLNVLEFVLEGRHYDGGVEDEGEVD